MNVTKCEQEDSCGILAHIDTNNLLSYAMNQTLTTDEATGAVRNSMVSNCEVYSVEIGYPYRT